MRSCSSRCPVLSVALMLVAAAPLASAIAAQVVTLPTIRASSLPDEHRLAVMVAALRTGKKFDETRPCDAALVDWIVQGSLSTAQLRTYYGVLRDSMNARGTNALNAISAYTPDSTSERLHLGSIARLYRCPDTFVKEAVDDSTLRPRTVHLQDIDLYVARAHVTMAPGDPQLLRVDSLARIARQLVVRRNAASTWFPVTNRAQAMEFWQQVGVSTLNVAAISVSSEKGAAYTELASPILHAVRLSINAVISGGQSEAAAATATPVPTAVASPASDKETVNRFLTGGGVVNLSAAWPFMHVGRENQAFDVTALVAPRVGGTLPALGSTRRDTSAVADLGMELHLKSVDLADGVGIFVQSRASKTVGSQKFYELLGEASGRSFTYTTLGAGLLLGGKYLLMAQRVLTGPSALQSLGWQVSVTAVRGGIDPITEAAK